MYKCAECQKSFEIVDWTTLRCPYCGHRVLIKQRGPVAKYVKAE
jgi:DNA-directed RNA polymerase subunit P